MEFPVVRNPGIHIGKRRRQSLFSSCGMYKIFSIVGQGEGRLCFPRFPGVLGEKLGCKRIGKDQEVLFVCIFFCFSYIFISEGETLEKGMTKRFSMILARIRFNVSGHRIK